MLITCVHTYYIQRRSLINANIKHYIINICQHQPSTRLNLQCNNFIMSQYIMYICSQLIHTGRNTFLWSV